ncbi:hypothetical protein NS220_07100 [Microbacterium testaceum]|uniref:Uncharacterized protein n=1 Tax=Microbacterium testaceum TaxID=2033 RepID=A0A147EYD9_MICTE|nr:hypothetical protein [Microbacterium testaceum]KTR95096.1 hypothetical protein NS220_07100 [Microbacterium testaceum]
MGLFVQRPEEPSEWAGLPGEPVRPRSRAEVLPDDEPVNAASADLLGVGETSLSSITISLDEVVPPAAEESSAADPVASAES